MGMKKGQAQTKKIVVKQEALPSTPPTITPTAAFTKQLAREIVKNLTAFGRLTAQPFQRKTMSTPSPVEPLPPPSPDTLHPVLVDTSVLIDGRIVPIVNSGFFTGTLLVPQYVIGEVQHIADSSDSLRRSKGRRGLDVAQTLKNQKSNQWVKWSIVPDDAPGTVEVDQKLVNLAKRWKVPLLTVDFNLAQVARVEGVKVMNINDLAQALKIALMPGEEVIVKITHEGKERAQGVGYLPDGTMVVVEDTKENIGQEVTALITKIHQTPAGQLFFGRRK